MNYARDINDNYNLKYPTIRSINDKKAVRMYRLGENYTPEYISKKVIENPYHYQQKYMAIIHPKKSMKLEKEKIKLNLEINFIKNTREFDVNSLFVL